jgi:hypothetical protein
MAKRDGSLAFVYFTKKGFLRNSISVNQQKGNGKKELLADYDGLKLWPVLMRHTGKQMESLIIWLILPLVSGPNISILIFARS